MEPQAILANIPPLLEIDTVLIWFFQWCVRSRTVSAGCEGVVPVCVCVSVCRWGLRIWKGFFLYWGPSWRENVPRRRLCHCRECVFISSRRPPPFTLHWYASNFPSRYESFVRASVHYVAPSSSIMRCTPTLLLSSFYLTGLDKELATLPLAN